MTLFKHMFLGQNSQKPFVIHWINQPVFTGSIQVALYIMVLNKLVHMSLSVTN